MTDPKPCPFCGINLAYLNRWMEYYHADGDCILGGTAIPDNEELIEQWNRRVNE